MNQVNPNDRCIENTKTGKHIFQKNSLITIKDLKENNQDKIVINNTKVSTYVAKALFAYCDLCKRKIEVNF